MTDDERLEQNRRDVEAYMTAAREWNDTRPVCDHNGFPSFAQWLEQRKVRDEKRE